ncbi:hypothetical protein [Paenibacillus polysaccharolyticus]|uniref:hypothetical protein n=1 Tax=Paenibacillus polysaccharolyticus TaxID=582692 RepID=UPI00142DC9D0|nr:hypothetical protein [Paenibacillus polysaccharolyticus]
MKPVWTTILAMLLLTGCAATTTAPQTTKNDVESVVNTAEQAIAEQKLETIED